MNAKTTKLIIAGLLLAMLAGMIPLLAPRLMIGALAIPTILMLVVVTVILIVTIISTAKETDDEINEKRKREDIYAAIDRMVDDLDADERAYLQERLDDREFGFIEPEEHARQR